MLYALGEEHRIVGISGFTVRPPRARQEKPQGHRLHQRQDRPHPRAAARPGDRLLRHPGRHRAGADQGRRRGVDQPTTARSSSILGYVRRLGAMVGAERPGAAPTRDELRGARRRGAREPRPRSPRRPRVYFEEWDEPAISAIRWVSELIGIAGGDDVFPERAAREPGRGSHRRRPAARSCARRPTSSSARGAARSSGPSRWRRARAGTRCRRCATASCTR